MWWVPFAMVAIITGITMLVVRARRHDSHLVATDLPGHRRNARMPRQSIPGQPCPYHQ